MSSEVIMDHFLVDGREVGKDLGLGFWGQSSPDVLGPVGHASTSHS